MKNDICLCGATLHRGKCVEPGCVCTTYTTHTPGPWEIIEGENGLEAIQADQCERIADGVTQANARLIAAAPELLDALEAMRDAMTSGPERILRDDEISALMKARNATAKAEGR